MSYQEVVVYWRDSSERDFEVAQGLVKLGHYAYALFFCHLALEKMLKAAYVARNKKHAPFTHKLVFLAIESSLPITEEMKSALDTITGFNINTRYADWKKEFYEKYDRKEYAEEYVMITRNTLLWLKGYLIQK